jgi:hypothetical protein
VQIPRDARVVDVRFANGDICLGAIPDGRLAHLEPAPEGRAAWDYDIFLRRRSAVACCS